MAKFDTEITKNKRDRWDLVQKQRRMLETSEKENRALSTEERSEFDKMNTAIAGLDTRLTDLENVNKESDEAPPAGPDDRSHRPGEIREGKPGDKHGTAEYRANFEHYLRTGERRDMTVGTGSSGGSLLAPVQTSADVVKQVDDMVFIRKLARIYKVDKAQALGVRKMTSRISDADWTTEVGQLSPESTMAFDRRDLNPQLLSKLVTASIKLIQSGVEVGPIVNEEMAYKFGVTEEKAYMTGNGSGKPLGIYVASNNGIPTSQDITSGASGGYVADDFIKMKYGIKGGYLTGPSVGWALSRPVTADVRMFKDSNGRYQWQPGLAADKPDTLLDIPVYVSEYAPSVKTAGSYVAVLGNFKYYAIAEIPTLFIQRLDERYADINEVGFIGRRFVDGSPVLGEAFVRLKTAA